MDALPELPGCIRTVPEGFEWTQVKYGKSGTAVYRLDFRDTVAGPDRPPLYAHGDFSVGNILLDNRKVTGCIDVERTGTADRYQDLPILWNDLSEFGQDVQTSFFEAYGIATPDLVRLQFHLCLDELF